MNYAKGRGSICECDALSCEVSAGDVSGLMEHLDAWFELLSLSTASCTFCTPYHCHQVLGSLPKEL